MIRVPSGAVSYQHRIADEKLEPHIFCHNAARIRFQLSKNPSPTIFASPHFLCAFLLCSSLGLRLGLCFCLAFCCLAFILPVCLDFPFLVLALVSSTQLCKGACLAGGWVH